MNASKSWKLKQISEAQLNPLRYQRTHHTIMTPNEFQATLLCMDRFGGSFVKSLAGTLRCADPSNRQRIWDAFPHLLEEFGPTGRFQQSKEILSR